MECQGDSRDGGTYPLPSTWHCVPAPQQGSSKSDVLVLKWDTSSALQRELLTFNERAELHPSLITLQLLPQGSKGKASTGATAGDTPTVAPLVPEQ